MHSKYERLTTNSLGKNRRGLSISQKSSATKTPIVEVDNTTPKNDSCLNIDLVVPLQRAFEIDETPNKN
jgi:hypothetical protein